MGQQGTGVKGVLKGDVIKRAYVNADAITASIRASM